MSEHEDRYDIGIYADTIMKIMNRHYLAPVGYSGFDTIEFVKKTLWQFSERRKEQESNE